MKVSECQKNGETRWMVIYLDPAKAGQVYPYTRAFFKTRRAAEVFVQGQTADAAGLLATWEEFGIHERLDAIRALKRSIAGGYTLSQACDLAESRGGTAISFDELVRRTVEAKRRKGVRARSLRELSWTLANFNECHPGVVARDVTPEMVGKWLDRPEWGQVRRRGLLVWLSAAFAFGVRSGLLARNPCAAVERPVSEPGETRIATPGQVQALFAWLEQNDPELIGHAALCAFAGLRPESEAARLNHAAIQAAVSTGQLATPAANKTRRRRVVAVAPNLAAFLSRWVRLGVQVRPVNFGRRWGAARRAAGGEWSQDILRHSWVSYRLALTGDDARTALEAGHTQEELHRSYKALATREAAAAWFAIMPTVDDYAPAVAARREAMRSQEVEAMRELARKRHAGDTLARMALDVLRPLQPWTMAKGIEVLRAAGREKESARNTIRGLIRSGAVTVDRTVSPSVHTVN